MKGKIEQLTKSKSGKAWRVMVDGRWFGAKFDSKIDSIPIGGRIDFLYDTDPKYGDWISSWGPDTSPQPVTTASPTPARGNGDRWWLPFCSNQIAHLIQVGVIKDRTTLNQWAKDLKECVTALDAL